MSSPFYSTKSIDHLGLVAGACEEFRIAETVDSFFPNQLANKPLSYGKVVVAMLLNGLGFVSRTLHLYSDYFADKAVERLLGPDIKAEHLNDDVLGRCLDKLYEANVSEVYEHLAYQVIQSLGLDCQSLHLDSTSFHVDGAYKSDDDEQKCIRLVKGYSRDHRPDLNQVILNLITENQAGIPLFMQASSGNTVDTEGFKQIVKHHVKSLKAAQNSQYFVADAALYIKESIQHLHEQNRLFVSRVPYKLKEAKALVDQIDETTFEEMGDGYHGAWFDSHYGDVKQKWILIRSEQAYQRECKTLSKKLHKEADSARKSFNKLGKQTFACKQDAQNALQVWQAQHDIIEVQSPQIITKDVYSSAGRPTNGEKPMRTDYLISGNLSSRLDMYKKRLDKCGLFIIATNDCSGDKSMADFLRIYKAQQAVEKGFRFLKSPDFLTSSIFLKKPERIEALLMIMTCCLMIYAALEHRIRSGLKASETYFPDMKKKPTQNPTARWVFFCCSGVHELTVEGKKLVINLQERQKVIIDCLGPKYWEKYS